MLEPIPTEDDGDEQLLTFGRALAGLINVHNIDTITNTPDWELSQMICDVLRAYIRVRRRQQDAEQDLQEP